LIAHSILNCKPLPDEPIAAQKFFVFNALLAESFAGACETIGQFFASDNIHRWMYRQNTNVYGCDNPQYLDLLQQLSGKYSLKFCLQLAVFSFLHWNFFCLTFDQNALNQVLPFCTNSVKVSSKDHSLLLIFCRFHFNIHNWFRKQIAEFYFSSQGFNRPLAELLGFDFISFLKKNRALQIKLQKLIDIPLDTHERGKFRNEV